MEFLIFSNGNQVDESLVRFALKTYYGRYKQVSDLCRVHPSMVERTQAILTELSNGKGKLPVQPNGGTLANELELAKPLPEKQAPAQLRMEV